MGGGSNNYAELLALKLLIKLAAEKGVTRYHVFGDSSVVINWMNGKLLKLQLFLPGMLAPELASNMPLIFNGNFHFNWWDLNWQECWLPSKLLLFNS